MGAAVHHLGGRGVTYWAILGGLVVTMGIQDPQRMQGITDDSSSISGEPASYAEDARR